MKVLAPLAQSGRINEEAGIRDKQSIIINAPILEVWTNLVDVSEWTSWNPDIRSVKITEVREGHSFKWNLKGQTITSTFRKITHPSLLTWTTVGHLTKSVQVWKLDEAGANQTIVSAEESIEGIFSLFIGHQKLHSTLINWLERLKIRCES